MPANYRVQLNMSKLQEIEREAPGRAAAVVQKIAQDCERDIKDSFSSESPSTLGDPPGVDTGALKNSIIAEPEGDLTWILHDGVEYGVHLEYGTENMGARPFVLPAIERAVSRIPPSLLKKVVGDG